MIAPRGIPHSFRVESETARFLGLSTPAGHERFFREAGQPALERMIPVDVEVDHARLEEVCARHQVEILGPPPGVS